jgi:hypothetical protein
MAVSDKDRDRMKRIILHAAQVQDGLVPEDSPGDFTVPQPLDARGLPWWFGPDYHPTDEALGEAFGGPMSGITGRLEKLRDHLNTMRFKTPEVEAKVDGLIFATGMLVDLMGELAKEVAKFIPLDGSEPDGKAPPESAEETVDP